MKSKHIIIVLGLLFLLVPSLSFAQCSMCRATVESNLHEANTQAAGLNAGILYLMSVPYIAFAVIGYFWYKKSKRTNAYK